MYNYHTLVIWIIDIVLLAASGLLAIIIIIYELIKSYVWNSRNHALLNLKRNTYELVLSGQGPAGDKRSSIFAHTTPQQFLDAVTNRNREFIFFNDAEQAVLKNCYISPQKIKEFEAAAGKNHSKWSRIEAIMCLGYTDSHSATKTLERSLNDKDEDVTYFSIISLGQIRTVQSAAILLRYLKRHSLGRYKIVSVLETFPAEIVDVVSHYLKDRDPSIRFWAIKIMSKFKSDNYLSNIELLASDPSAEVRAAACECLGNIGKGEVRSTLVKCLEDDSWLVRMNAVEALSEALGSRCLPDVICMVNDGSLSVIESVKRVLAAHIKAALPDIDKFLHSDNVIAKRISVEAIEESGYITELLKKLISDEKAEKDYAVHMLKGMVKACIHFGLEGALSAFDEKERELIIKTIRCDIDVIMARNMSQGEKLE